MASPELAPTPPRGRRTGRSFECRLARIAVCTMALLLPAVLAGCARPPQPTLPQPTAGCEQLPPTRVIEVGGVQLRYAERGQGEPAVVLLHGNGAMIEDFALSGVLDRAAVHHRTVVFDRPGFRDSQRPRDRTWTPQAQAALLVEVFARLEIERPVIVGHSWGTLVALALATEHPEAVGGLVLISGYYYPTGRADLAVSAALAAPLATPVLGDVLRHTVMPLVQPAAEQALVEQMFAPVPAPECFAAEFPFAQILQPRQQRASAEETTLLEPSAAAFAPRYQDLRGLPVVIVAGADDRLIDPARQSERLHQELPGSLLVVVPGQDTWSTMAPRPWSPTPSRPSPRAR